MTIPETDLTGRAGYAEAVRRARQSIPHQHEGRLQEVGLLAVCSASTAADRGTGETLYLDGGLTL